MPAFIVRSSSRLILSQSLKQAIAVAVFFEIPGVVANCGAGVVKIARSETNLSTNAGKVTLPTPVMDFRAIQYFKFSTSIDNCLIVNAICKCCFVGLVVKKWARVITCWQVVSSVLKILRKFDL